MTFFVTSSLDLAKKLINVFKATLLLQINFNDQKGGLISIFSTIDTISKIVVVVVAIVNCTQWPELLLFGTESEKWLIFLVPHLGLKKNSAAFMNIKINMPISFNIAWNQLPWKYLLQTNFFGFYEVIDRTECKQSWNFLMDWHSILFSIWYNRIKTIQIRF